MGLLVLGLIAAVIAGCATGPAAACPAAVAGRSPGGLIPEVQVDAKGPIEVWALVMPSRSDIPLGSPISLRAGEDVKILWRATGRGELGIYAVGPDRARLDPNPAPRPHPESSWQRPGDEWATGWTFPAPGCWRIIVERGGSTAVLTVHVGP